MHLVRHRMEGTVFAPWERCNIRLWRARDGRQRFFVQLRNVRRIDAAGAVDIMQRAIETLFAESIRNGVEMTVIREPGGGVDGP